MTIRCGNCKDEHATTDEVKACYGVLTLVRESAPSRETERATPRQLSYALALEGKRAPDEVRTLRFGRFGPTPEMDRNECSRWITVLLETPLETRTSTTPRADVEVERVENGTYTVVLGGDDDYVTLRLRAADFARDLPTGSQVIEYLSGPDNAVAYTGFGFIVNGRLRIWRRFDLSCRPVEAARVLLGATTEELCGSHERFLQLAEAYALRSGRCVRCARKLTVPTSLHRGLGPVCAGLEGVA